MFFNLALTFYLQANFKSLRSFAGITMRPCESMVQMSEYFIKSPFFLKEKKQQMPLPFHKLYAA